MSFSEKSIANWNFIAPLEVSPLEAPLVAILRLPATGNLKPGYSKVCNYEWEAGTLVYRQKYAFDERVPKLAW